MTPHRTALVHDWLTGMRGGERVLEALCDLNPGADLLTLIHVRGTVSPIIERHHIRTSFIQHIPLATTRYRSLLPIFPFAIESLNLDPYELVISSSHCVAKSVVVSPQARHLCYCHSPMRYAWDQFDAYFGPDRVGAFRSRWVYRPILSRLARWDAATAGRVHRFVANSAHVAARIRRYYNREAVVAYPPVDTDFYRVDATPKGRHFLVVSALVPYKRVEWAIEACARVGAPLRVVGTGPDQVRLERLAGPHVTFLGSLRDEEVRHQYREALAVLLPGEEDFGIVPVEAQACGTPVVALARGGALETVVPDETGVLFEDPSPSSLASALERVSSARFAPERLRAHAERFSRSRFDERMRDLIADTLAAPVGRRW